MVYLKDIVNYCDELLDIYQYRDYAPNGLQIEGRSAVSHVVSGVTASQALIDRAIDEQADLLLVHHGYFWKGEPQPLTGIKRNRIAALLKNNISLVAYHLPLDGHSELGNNAQLGQLWGYKVQGYFGEGPTNKGLACYTELSSPKPVQEVVKHLSQTLQNSVTLYSGGEHPCRRIGWCSGGAESYLQKAADLGLDLFISGEVSEPVFHQTQENGIHYIAAGHHATERGGVNALGDHLAQQFQLKHQFIDVFNPI